MEVINEILNYGDNKISKIDEPYIDTIGISNAGRSIDKLPIEVIIKIVNTINDLDDQINFIAAITWNVKLLKKYKNGQLTQNEIRIIKYFIPFNIPFPKEYIDHYTQIFMYASLLENDFGFKNDLEFNYDYQYSCLYYCRLFEVKDRHSKYPNDRRNIHNFFKTKLMKLNLSESNEQLKKLLNILNRITSIKLKRVCAFMEWQLYIFYRTIYDTITLLEKEEVIDNISYFFDMFNPDEYSSSCKTCKLAIKEEDLIKYTSSYNIHKLFID